jgi:LPS O-antigen subunit length determinant protein (WzzB/FepE family)
MKMTDPIIPMVLIGMFVGLDLVLLRHVMRKEKRALIK